ncbi:pejvakin-like [Watersipora subatra]|uniref:pejvakin-like n=1 Tax=Watersipora subatra TaxID=2589382 RepID=UPI00355BE3F9
MFARVAHQLVKSIGPDIYFPSPSIGSATNIAPLSLVVRKSSKWWLVEDSHYPTNFSLQDVLEGSPLSVDMEEEKDLVSFNASSTIKITASLSAQLKSFFESELKDVDNIGLEAKLGDLHISQVNEQSLIDQLRTRKLNMNHELVKELAGKDRRALCIVTAVVKTAAPASINSTLNIDVSGDEDVKLPAVGEEGKGEVTKGRTRALILPVGTVLAYEIVELAVSSQGAMRVMVARSGKGGFNSELLDESDSVASTSVSTESLANKLEGLSLLNEASRKALVVHLLELCADPLLLKQLSKALKGAAGDSVDSAVERVLACLNGAKGDETANSLQFLCKLLRSLPLDQIDALSKLEPTDLPILSAVLERTYTGSCLAYTRGKTQQFVTDKGSALDFLIAGLGYTLGEEGITPPDYSVHLLQTVFAVIFALSTCYDSDNDFVFE